VRTLVLGGIRSGKSRWAESALSRQPAVRYLATGPHGGDAAPWARRIAEHRSRRPASWSTVETADVATELSADPHTATLVDDLGNWLTRTLDERGWDSGPLQAEVDDLLAAVAGFVAPLVLVSPEVGLTVIPETPAGRRFADELGTLNQRVAACCDEVVLVVAGQPVTVKPAREG
jgi:adenosylcobinamide kinase/adenosylcobinamide-phosphate guanylyltransferase